MTFVFPFSLFFIPRPIYMYRDSKYTIILSGLLSKKAQLDSKTKWQLGLFVGLVSGLYSWQETIE